MTRPTRAAHHRPAWAAPWPDAAARATSDRHGRVRARLVAYGVVLTLLATAAVEAEIWPLTAYRLFSTARTDTITSLDLVASTADGDVVVRPADDAEPLVTTTRQYGDLAAASPHERRTMVGAWLDLAGIDPADVSAVRLERVARTHSAGAWAERSRQILLEVVP
ncbi:hypothetical protein [Oerskovia turbata]